MTQKSVDMSNKNRGCRSSAHAPFVQPELIKTT